MPDPQASPAVEESAHVNPDPEPKASFASGRILSVDALRGFDMFWIIGVDEVVWAAEQSWPNAFTHVLAAPLRHREWAGFNFYDLVFPMFIFLVGVSTVFSLSKTLRQENWVATYRRIFRRFFLLNLRGYELRNAH